jgi:hypothetical protein
VGPLELFRSQGTIAVVVVVAVAVVVVAEFSPVMFQF